MHGWVISETRAAGMPPSIAVGNPVMIGSGIGGWGIGVGTGPAG
jgi:hypothetical protein